MYADPYHTYMRFCYIIPTGKFNLIFYFREEEKNNYSVYIPCLKSVGLLFDLSLHSNLFHSTEQTYLLYVVSKWFKYSYILMSSEIQKRNMTQLTLQYIFHKYWGLKTAIAESNSDFEKSPDFIRLHAHSINFKNQLLYQVFSFSTEISFHKKSPILQVHTKNSSNSNHSEEIWGTWAYVPYLQSYLNEWLL